MIKTGKDHSHRGLAKRIGANLKAHRLAREEAQVSVARALKLSQTHVGLVERGQKLVSLPTLGEWCSYLGVDIGDVCAKPKEAKADPQKRALLQQLSGLRIRTLRRVIALIGKST